MRAFPRFDRASLLGTVHFDPRWPPIGPHEGRAAWLMSLGWKPAAYFCDGEDFDPCDDELALMALADAGYRSEHIFGSALGYGAADIHAFVLRLYG